jgi:hypothetical protein
MTSRAAGVDDATTFAASREQFDVLVGWLSGGDAAGLTHAELEDGLATDGRELLRLLLQDHLDLRAREEARAEEVVDVAGVARTTTEASHRQLATVFGQVTVGRLAYRRTGHANLHPADAVLNLPAERHSHGLRRLAATEATRGSYDDATDAIARATGTRLGKRQTEQLTRRAAVDFDTFYATGQPVVCDPDDVLVVSVDGKGIVVRPDALRAATAKAAAGASTKLSTRLSKGEKANRKRMATVGAVYDTTPVVRTPAEIITTGRDDRDDHDPPAAPTATGKWLTASVIDAAATVIGRVFDEAERRDPTHSRDWVALVDGNNHQIARITAEAAARRVQVTVIVDFVHVLEYLWSAAWSFFDEADPAAEAWVADRATRVLAGDAVQVAAGIRRRATRTGLDPPQRRNADRAADYLANKADLLDYPTALSHGWPIATGVIEGACRHLVKDRMDLTGARWSLDGAEAILQLRALRTNGDLDRYWNFHLDQERRRVHESRYAPGLTPQAA